MFNDLIQSDKEKTYTLATGLLLCGTIFGFAAGSILVDYLNNKKTITGKYVLDHVKAIFAKDGEIEGSWVEMNARETERFGQVQNVILGGISRKEKGKLVQYEFTADAKTGNIMSLEAIH